MASISKHVGPTDERNPALGEAGASGHDATAQVIERPKASAGKGAWVDWAVDAHGMTEDEAEALTVDDLKDLP